MNMRAVIALGCAMAVQASAQTIPASLAPSGECAPGATARVAYTADYRFLRRQ